MDIQALLKQTDKLPNVPDVVRQLILQLNNPAADYGDIAAKVAHDQTLSLKILRLVNSAHFGLRRKVSSIEEAVIMLGMSRLKTLVIATGLAGSVKQVEGLALKAFWQQSFQVAALSKWLAERSQQTDPDIAFTAGLIHNIGRLLLHLMQPQNAEEINSLMAESGCSRNEAEQQCLGFTTPEAAQALLQLWHFPPELGIAVAQHRQPLDTSEPTALAAIIFLACRIEESQSESGDLASLQKHFSPELLLLAGLPETLPEQLDEVLSLQSGLDELAA